MRIRLQNLLLFPKQISSLSPDCLLLRQNFLANAVEAQIEVENADGSLTSNGRFLQGMDFLFTSMFAVELVLNLYCHWLRPFFCSGWNVLDLIVVALSLIALGPIPIPISVVRMIRVFRVVRLFGRFESLTHIVRALTSAITPVLNAFSILLIFIFMCEHPPHPHLHV
jgi:hypothetical protein